MEKDDCEILNKVFSRDVFRRLIDGRPDRIYDLAVDRYADRLSEKTNGAIISEMYDRLRSSYRNEYFYKNTLFNKLVLGIHSVNTATAFTELPVAKSKADFVTINRNAVVYEIKTELDNFERLNSQVKDYYKGFTRVAVVSCKENLCLLEKKIDKLGRPVGIYVLQRNGALTTIRKPAEYRDDLDAGTLFKMLRKPEYEKIVLKWFSELPDVSDFKYYSECKRKFLEIPLDEAYLDVLEALRGRTRLVKEKFADVPLELKFLVYFMDLKEGDYKKLEQFLKKPCRLRPVRVL